MTSQSTFARDMAALDSETKDKFRSILARYDENAEDIETEAFSAIIRLAHLFIGTGEFCTRFGLTRSVVSAYRMGNALPAYYMRNEIICWIRERLEMPMAA